MTCEKCIHYEVCQYRGGRAYEADRHGELPRCKYFGEEMNCIYETQKGQCGVTGDLECREPCGFKKTAEDMEKGKKLVHKRIRDLSEGEQEWISMKYYGGRRPWLTEK